MDVDRPGWPFDRAGGVGERQTAAMLQHALAALLLCPVGTFAQSAGFVRSWLDAVSSGAEVPGV